VLSDESIRRDFLKGVPKKDAKVVKAFVAANASNALKTRPKVSYSALSSLFLRNSPAFVMFVAVSCMLGGLHRCVAFEGDRVSSIEDAQLPSAWVLFNARHSYRRVSESEAGIDHWQEQLWLVAGDGSGSWGELPSQWFVHHIHQTTTSIGWIPSLVVEDD
jgi:hypothetical protein